MASSAIHLSHALLPEGWRRDVLVSLDAHGMITAVATGVAAGVAARFQGIAIPGVSNVHSHAHQRAMVGLAERSGPGSDSFWTWREAMYRFALKMGPEELEAAAAQLYVEMLKGGYTAVGEFQYLHHQPDGTPYAEPAQMSLRCLKAAESAGIAITLLPTLYAFGGFGEKPAAEGQRRFLNSADRYLLILNSLFAAVAPGPMRRLGISPHSLRAVSAELLDEVVSVFDAFDPTAPIHIHVAEQTKEVEDCCAWSGERPVDYLLNHFEVDARWCAIHATHTTANENTRLAESGTVAGLCPTTEANLGDGIFDALTFCRAGGVIAIGSDSHVTVSPAEDLRQLEYSQRLLHRRRNVLSGGPDRSTGRALLEAALAGGARALGQRTGAIAPGRRCDIVVLDPEHPSLVAREKDEVLDSWIFAAGTSAVKDVIVAGEHLVQHRRHVREEPILDAFRAAMHRLRE